jgi:hypothetical protein
MTRREWLCAAALLGGERAWGAANDFWNRRPAAEWTSAEIVQLLSVSPWARSINIALPGTGLAAGAADPSQQAGQRDPTTTAGGARGPDITESRRKSGPPKGHLVVRWESAAPVREALRTRLPAEFDGHYVVSVEGIDPSMLVRPNTKDGSLPEITVEDQLSRLREGARLEVKGKESLAAGVVDFTGRFRYTWRFGFSKELLTLEPADRDLGFSIKAGSVRFRADFAIKEMMYRGALAV